MMLIRLLLFFPLFGFCNLLIHDENLENESASFQETVNLVVQIIEEQPTAIEDWTGNRIYLVPERISINRVGTCLRQKNSIIQLPSLASDSRGIFLKCGQKLENKEAQEHYDKAAAALRDAVFHSIGVGAVVEIPPLAAIELYNAVQAWKEAAMEYNAGYECEHGPYDPFGKNSSLSDRNTRREANGRNEPPDNSYDPYHSNN